MSSRRTRFTHLTESNRPSWAMLAVMLLVYPFVASDFFTFQIGAYSLILGIISLSLMLLAGYGGMISLAQLTVAGIAGYVVAIFGVNSVGVLGFGWPWWLVVPLAVLLAALCGALIGLIAVRSSGIYMLMITLAIAVSFFYFVRQNYVIFNGFSGFAGIATPVFAGVSIRDPRPFYYLTLFFATLFFVVTVYGSRTTFGLSLQAIRDNPRRMYSLGFNVVAHRVFAFFIAGLIAGIGGVLLVWFNGRISPGSVGISVAIDILVIAILGGIKHPLGPFVGALCFVLLENFAIDLIDRDRFNTVIGVVFLIIVFVSPDGILGLWHMAKNKTTKSMQTTSTLPTRTSA